MTKPLNICLIAPNITGNGGAERALVNIDNYFSKDGHEVTMLVRDSGSAYSLNSNIELFKVPV